MPPLHELVSRMLYTQEKRYSDWTETTDISTAGYVWIGWKEANGWKLEDLYCFDYPKRFVPHHLP